MNNRIMWRIENEDTLVLFPENGTAGVSQGCNQESEFDVYNAETNKREYWPIHNKKLKFMKTEGKLVFHGSLSSIFALSRFIEIDLTGFDTSNVTNMSSMFQGSIATRINLSSFDTSNVTDMSYMFASSKIKELDLTNFDTSNVTNMKCMFSHLQVKELDLTSFTISYNTNIDYIFSNTPNTRVSVNKQFAKQIKESTIE